MGLVEKVVSKQRLVYILEAAECFAPCWPLAGSLEKLTAGSCSGP